VKSGFSPRSHFDPRPELWVAHNKLRALALFSDQNSLSVGIIVNFCLVRQRKLQVADILHTRVVPLRSTTSAGMLRPPWLTLPATRSIACSGAGNQNKAE
jgi:hypothetical protein